MKLVHVLFNSQQVHFIGLQLTSRSQSFLFLGSLLFSAECTIGMVRGLTPLKHYGSMALWRYGTMELWHYGTMEIRCKL